MPILKLDDIPLYYQDFGEGDHTLLALHASTVSGNLLRWALPKNRPFRVLLPDQRGHGQTPNPAPDFQLQRLIDDMLNLLDVLDLPTIHGIGYSLGATVLLGMALEYPERFESLILLGATHRRPTDDQVTQIAGPLEERRGLTREVLHPETGIVASQDFDLAEMSKLDFPVYLIGGDHDQVALPADYVTLYNALPNGHLLIAPGCDHYCYYQNPLVKDYLTMIYDELVS